MTRKKSDRIQRARFAILRNIPFLATLLLEGEFRILEDDDPIANQVKTAATDGRSFFFNRSYCESLSDDKIQSIIAHEVLHCALSHLPRGKKLEDKFRANYAADVIVNALVEEMGLKLDPNWVSRREWAELCMEEIYRLLEDDEEFQKASEVGECLSSVELSEAEAKEADKRWQQAVETAKVNSKLAGNTPGDLLSKILGTLAEPQLNYRELLYDYLCNRPSDFNGYDKRFVDRGDYIDHFSGDSITVNVFVDTSGSCVDQLPEMMPEIVGILESFDWVDGNLYYFDAETYGPFEISEWEQSQVSGGGGTVWAPINAIIQKGEESFSDVANIVITDGYLWDMPKSTESEVVWIITRGGKNCSEMPENGKCARLD